MLDNYQLLVHSTEQSCDKLHVDYCAVHYPAAIHDHHDDDALLDVLHQHHDEHDID